MNAWPDATQELLLKAALLKSEESWKRWSSLIDLPTIDPASFKLLPFLVKEGSFGQGEILSKSKGIYRKNWLENHLSWRRTLQILKMFQEEGIEKVVVLKGMAMILSVYQDFGIRVLGDIDILIRREDLNAALKIFERLEWKHHIPRFSSSNLNHLRRWHSLNFISPEGLLLDLHWSFIQENCEKLDAFIFEKTLKTEVPSVYTPCATDLLLQACVHGVKYSPVPLIRWVADAFFLIQKKEIDWTRLTHLAQTACVSLPIYHALEYLKKTFLLPIPEKVLVDLESTKTLHLEQLEYQANLKGYPKVGDWHRFCLKNGHFSLVSRLFHLPHYCKDTARLRSFWLLPFFGVYWILKRLFKKVLFYYSLTLNRSWMAIDHNTGEC